MRLSLAALDRLPRNIARPAFDPRTLRCGILHLGVGNFHRAHQAVFTEDAMAKAGGDWGIIGVSLRRPDTANLLDPQDGLYTVETLGEEKSWRVIGALRRVLVAPAPGAGRELFAAFADPNIHIVTLTITEKGYGLSADGVFDSEQIGSDLSHPDRPRSAIGWIVRGLARRKANGAGPLTIISCDNLSKNGARLASAVDSFARIAEPQLVSWIADNVAFPGTMVDCIVPATDAATIARVEAAIGLHDAAPVARERFAQWVLEDKFAGPRPAWEEAGVEIVPDAAPFERLKLHVLNGSHSALAYLGLPRGHTYVREAIADKALAGFVEAMVMGEMAPALAPGDVAGYWRGVRARFANPSLDHRLAQVAEDGSLKLAQRILPLIVENARSGRPFTHLARVVRAWLAFAASGPVKDGASERLDAWAKAGASIAAALDDPALFPDPFRTDAKIRAAILEATP